jgi:hypothetical protein
MKIVLVVIIIALAGLAGWIKVTASRPTELHRELIADLKADLSESEQRADRAERELSLLKTEISELKRRLEIPAVETVGVVNVPGPGSSASQPGVVTDSDADQIAQIESIYALHRDPLEKKSRELSDEIAILNLRRNQVANTTLTFSEQSVATDIDGNFTGNRGVRTSQADRDRAQAKLDDEVKEIEKLIRQYKEDMAKVDKELFALKSNYTRALGRARSGQGVK